MKLSALLLALIMTVSLLPVSVFAAPAPDYDLKVLTFEDSDYKGGTNFAGQSDWSSLIDDPQYGGQLLYGPDGTGFTDENEAYTWSDDNNTCLTHKFPYNYNAYCYWGGGHAISNYSTGDIADYGGFQTQLTVYKAGVKGLSRTGGGHNGSNNFAVHYGYMDGSSYNKTEVLPALSFNDNVARVIDHMYVNNTTYALNCYIDGNDLTGKIGDDDWVKLVATGYNAAGEKTGTAELYLCNGPKNIIMDWTKWDLSCLGKVVKVDFNVTGSSDNGYGFSQPAYFAYDDVAVRFEKEPVVATEVQLSQTELTMTKGETAQLTAKVLPENTTDTLTWTSSAETVATVADGKVTALKAGTATITAACGSVKAECTVTVKEEAGPITVSVNGAPCTIEKVTDPSDSSKLIYRALAPYGSGVTINVKDASFLMVQDSKYGYINEEGANPFSLTAAQLEKLLVKNKGLAFTPADTSKIAYMSIMDAMAGATYDLYIELTREITPATGVTMNQDTLTLRSTQTAQLTAAVQPEDTTDTLTWSTSNDTVATVADGKVTALKPGTATITAAAGNVKAECAVTVLDPIPASAVVLDKTALSLYEGDIAALTATVQPEDTTVTTVTWTSTEKTVATVADGKITALKAGTTTITAACGDVKAECKVTVKAPTEPALVDGVYQIGLNSELVWFAKQVNSGKTGISCKLVNDIDLENINWTPIGNTKAFAGSIDGDGHTIKNLSVAYTVKGRESAYLGLVGRVTGTADSRLAIKNLTVEGRIDVTGSASFYSCYIGGVVGRGQYVDLSNVVSRVTVAIEKTVGNSGNVGGMAGTLINSNVTNCGNEGDVTGSSNLGGLVQQLYSGTMAGCYNTGKVTGSGTYVGGVLAYAKQATVKDIYNTGDVTSRKSLFGGLIGVMEKSSLTNAYNTGKVTATEGESGSASFGSAVGESENLTNVYYLEGTAAKGVGKGTGEATAKTAEELKAMAATLGESFKEDATGINGGYPVLTWQLGEVCQHTVTEVKNAQPPTCTTDGYTGDIYCKLCGAKISEGHAIAATGHKLTKTEAKAATCTEAGNSEYYTCSACGKYFSDAKGENEIAKDSWIIEANDHNMTKTAAKAATCTEAGNSEYYTCSACGKYFSDAKGENEIAKDSWIIEANDHNMTKTAAKAATCTEAGNSEYYTCSACGKYFSDAEGKNEIAKDSWVIEANGHNMTKTAAKAATCTEAGNSEYYTCSACGKYFSDAKGENEIAKDSWVIEAIGHDMTKTAAKAATCTEAGNSEYYTCSGCGKYFSDAKGENEIAKDSWIIKALGHVEVKDAAKAATCTETGLTEGVHCSRCNTVLKAQTETPALGHVEVKDAAKAATCTETGLTEGVHCSRCNTVLKAQTETPALGHSYKNGVCTRCGAKDPNYKPAAPTISTGFVASTGKPTVKWSTVSGAAKYQVYRAATRNGTYKLMGTVTGTSYTDESAYAGYIYFYKVRVVDAGGVKGNFSAIHSAICHCAKPVVSSGYVASTGKPTVKWSTVSGAAKYEVYRAATRNGTYKLMGTVTGTSYTDGSAYAGYIYFYKVRVVDAGGVKGNFSAIHSAICHCAKPVVSSGYVASTGKPTVKWSTVSGAAKYEVYRAATRNGTYKLMGTVTGTSYTDESADAGYIYFYKVKAVSKVRSAADSNFSAVVSATCHCAKPVVKITTSSGDPKLTWNAVTNASKYEVYRATSKTGTYTKVATTTAKSYTDKTAKAGTTYYYKVKAVSKVRPSANSAFSAIKSIKAK